MEGALLQRFFTQIDTARWVRLVLEFHFADCEIDNVTLPEDGVYTITVDGKDDEGGTYRWILNRLDGDLGGILYDESIQERISPAGDQDSFVFAGEANHRVTVDLLSLVVRGFRSQSSNRMFCMFCGFSADRCTIENVTPPQTGNYIVTVDAQGRGEYSYTLTLSLTCLSSCPPEPISTRTATPTATVILLPPDATRTPTPTETVPFDPIN